jgi:hypothetical protein
MGNVAVAEELTGTDELEELYELNTMSLRVFGWGRPRDLAFYAVLEASAVTGNVCLVGQVLLQAERHACRLCP